VIIADFLSIPIVIDKPAVDRRRAAHELEHVSDPTAQAGGLLRRFVEHLNICS